MSLSKLKEEITKCDKCPRLREYCGMQKGTNSVGDAIVELIKTCDTGSACL